MKKIELVIKIFEDTYKNIIENGFIYDEDNEEITYAIKNGISLPKGHGKLKDVSNLLTVTDYDGENEKTYVLYEEIENAPIIIEANEESEE